ncbi:MAG: AzlD domain-containing protein [Eubacterium sp.]|nr:AzlD domain-containing protein [Candidatus Colimonas fimequi]
MFDTHVVLVIAVASIVTIGLRSLPFIIWNGERKTPEYIIWLGNVLPYAIMGMLVVFCLKGTHITNMSEVVPAAIAVVFTAILQRVKHNSLLSILAGTVVYMVLIQII